MITKERFSDSALHIGSIFDDVVVKITDAVKKTLGKDERTIEIKRVEKIKSEAVRAREDFKRQYINSEALKRMQILLSEKQIKECLERTSCSIRFTIKKEYLDTEKYLGNYIGLNDSINISYDKKQIIPYSTTIHELTHYMTKGPKLYNDNFLLGGYISRCFDISYQEYAKKNNNRIVNEKNFIYLTNPQEIHARINEIRHICHPNDPRKEMTEQDIQEFIMKYGNDNGYGSCIKMLHVIKDGKISDFLHVCNTVF